MPQLLLIFVCVRACVRTCVCLRVRNLQQLVTEEMSLFIKIIIIVAIIYLRNVMQ